METRSPIKDLLIGALLYMPLCFGLWFYAAALLVLPVKWLTNLALEWWQPALFNGIEQQNFLLQIQTLITPKSVTLSPGQVAIVEVAVNPMKYGYGLAGIGGLVLAVPELKTKQRLMQFVLGYLLVCLIQANGVFWEAIKSLLFSGGEVFAAIDATGINHNLVVAMYQMAYLIVPAVLPVIFWVAFNKPFIVAITRYNTKGDGDQS